VFIVQIQTQNDGFIAEAVVENHLKQNIVQICGCEQKEVKEPIWNLEI